MLALFEFVITIIIILFITYVFTIIILLLIQMVVEINNPQV